MGNHRLCMSTNEEGATLTTHVSGAHRGTGAYTNHRKESPLMHDPAPLCIITWLTLNTIFVHGQSQEPGQNNLTRMGVV